MKKVDAEKLTIFPHPLGNGFRGKYFYFAVTTTGMEVNIKRLCAIPGAKTFGGVCYYELGSLYENDLMFAHLRSDLKNLQNLSILGFFRILFL